MNTLKNIYNNFLEMAVAFSFTFKLVYKVSKKLLAIRILLVLMGSMLPILGLWFFKEIINLLANAVKTNSINTTLLITLIVFYILSNVINEIITEVEYYFTLKSTETINRYIDNVMIDKMVSVDISFFENSKLKDQLNTIAFQRNVITGLAWQCFSVLTQIIRIISSFLILSSLNILLALIVIVFSIPTFIIQAKHQSTMYGYDKESSNSFRKIEYYKDLIFSKDKVYDIKLYNISDKLIDRYSNLWKKWFKDRNKLLFKVNMKNGALSTLFSLSTIGVFMLSIYKYIKGVIGIGDIKYYVDLTNQVYSGTSSIFKTMAEIYENRVKITDFIEFFNLGDIKEVNEGILIPNDDMEITFENVGFKYPGTKKWILRNLNFTFKSTEKISIVGINGAGKSTLVKLMLRFYKPTEGKILIDGIDISEYDVAKYREKFTALFQDYHNYSLNLGLSIVISDLENENDEERLKEACSMSGIDKIMENFEKGFETPMGGKSFRDDGVILSGGQWQKLALARAFFRRADMVILDEPSASLDPESEHLIFNSLLESNAFKGAILISHRLSNVINTDKIIVLENGEVAEQGTHEELLNNNETYAYLFNLQASKYTDLENIS